MQMLFIKKLHYVAYFICKYLISDLLEEIRLLSSSVLLQKCISNLTKIFERRKNVFLLCKVVALMFINLPFI